MEHMTKNMTKKYLSYKPVCYIKMRNISEDTRALEGNFHSVPGSSEHIVQYLYSYLSTHFFPYGCPVSSLDALYQNEYKPKFSRSQVEMINVRFLKEFSNHFVLHVGCTFVKLKEGVDHSDTSQLKGSPYTLQHVNDYFRRYLAQEGVVCTQQLRVLFSECYTKEFKMPQKPIIHFIQEDFFKGSHSAEVNENINLGYSQDQCTASFRVRVWFRAILLCLILKKGFCSLLIYS